MKLLEIDKDLKEFKIVSEKKSFFFNKIKIKTEVIKLEEIEMIEKHNYHNSFYSLTIFMKNRLEYFLLNEEYSNLKELDDYLIENEPKYKYEMLKSNLEDVL